jgi:hypothetical protein
MFFKTDLCPNPDYLSIHTTKRLIDKNTDSFDSKDSRKDEQPALVIRLFEIEGITEIQLTQYSIRFIKGKLFKWPELIPLIISVLEFQFEPDDLVEVIHLPDSGKNE